MVNGTQLLAASRNFVHRLRNAKTNASPGSSRAETASASRTVIRRDGAPAKAARLKKLFFAFGSCAGIALAGCAVVLPPLENRQSLIDRSLEKHPELRILYRDIQNSDLGKTEKAFSNVLQFLGQDVGILPRSLSNYFSNRWIAKYIAQGLKDDRDIPMAAVHEIHGNMRRQDEKEYSTSGFYRQVSIRNNLSYTCENIISRNWHGYTDCDYIRSNALLAKWPQWFARSPLQESILPYARGYKTILGKKIRATNRMCNAAPYRAQFAYYAELQPIEVLPSSGGLQASPGQTGWAKISSWVELSPGACIEHEELFVDREPLFAVASIGSEADTAQRIRDDARAHLLTDDNPSNDQFAETSEDIAPLLWQCVGNDQPNDGWIASSERSNCKEGRTAAGFNASYQADAHNSIYVLQDKDILLVSDPNGYNEASLQNALGEARNIAEVMSRQERFRQNWAGLELPFSLGADVIDFNGPLRRGVALANVQAKSLFEEDVELRSSDVIIAVNGKTVYGFNDLQDQIILHGLSRNLGINKKLRLMVLREGYAAPITVEHRYFFNLSYPANQGYMKLYAGMYGLLDSVFFGWSSPLVCIVKGASSFVASGVDNAFDTQFRSYIDYQDFPDCWWKADQQKALAQQKERAIYVYSGFAPTPGMMRVLFTRQVKGAVARRLGSGAISARIASGVLEAGETAAFSIGTEPPDTPAADKLRRGIPAAGFGFIGGFVLSTSR